MHFWPTRKWFSICFLVAVGLLNYRSELHLNYKNALLIRLYFTLLTRQRLKNASETVLLGKVMVQKHFLETFVQF